MQHKWVRLIALMALLLGLVACSTTTDEVVGEVPEFTDADLDAAQPLDSLSAERLNLSGFTGSPQAFLGDGQKSALAGLERSRLGTANADDSAGLELDTKGFIAYVSKVQINGKPLSFIRVRKSNLSGATKGRLIYKGSRQVDSVAISPDGKLLTFIMQAKDGNYEVYARDATGETLGLKQIVRLTQTEADESNISMSIDGKTHLWQGVDEESGLGNFTLATIDLDSVTASTLTVSAPFALTEPSLSGDASFITLIADIPDVGEAVSAVSSDLSSGLIAIYTGGDFAAPSFSYAAEALMFKAAVDGSDVVAFDDGAELTFLKAAPAGSIDHPYLTADANYFIYGTSGQVRISAVDVLDPAGAMKTLLTWWMMTSIARPTGQKWALICVTLVRPWAYASLRDLMMVVA